MKTQYRLLLPFIIAVLICSCSKKKKDDLPPPQEDKILLSTVYGNGKPAAKFHYDADDRLTRMDFFSGDGALLTYVAISYNAQGFPAQTATYRNPGDIPLERKVIACDARGLPVRFDYTYLDGPPPPGITRPDYEEHSYNGQSQLIKTESKETDGTLITRTNFSYFANGALKEQTSWKTGGLGLWKFSETIYSVSEKDSIPGLDAFNQLLEHDFIATFYSELITFYVYDQNGIKKRHETTAASGRVYHDNGTLNRQNQLRKTIIPPQEDFESVLSYEYTAE
ncbi:hypothetical protein [Chitinophaga alhagiae]|uniref:hypothetical protein n=1 Tax=Chitinophaga alhagiae TaxID=2203219 RepID=UPI001300A9C2|nr:hypothetical protein [Chitinophaga alhagiae]